MVNIRRKVDKLWNLENMFLSQQDILRQDLGTLLIAELSKEEVKLKSCAVQKQKRDTWPAKRALFLWSVYKKRDSSMSEHSGFNSIRTL